MKGEEGVEHKTTNCNGVALSAFFLGNQNFVKKVLSSRLRYSLFWVFNVMVLLYNGHERWQGHPRWKRCASLLTENNDYCILSIVAERTEGYIIHSAVTPPPHFPTDVCTVGSHTRPLACALVIIYREKIIFLYNKYESL